MVKKKKILFFVYCLLVSALSIGWYPQNQNKQVKKDITLVRKSSEKMAALVENNQFCYQGVTETDMDERRMNTQEDEKQRRTVKTIVRYRVNLEHGARRILERIRKDWIDSVDVLIADLPCSGLGVIGGKCDIKPYEIRKISELCA